jgi:ribosomal protein L24
MRFGTALESAIQFFHENNMRPGATSEEFIRLWTKVKEIPNLVYTDKEGDWDTMLHVGAEMGKLYEVKLPTFPIKAPRFQLCYKKELYPRTYLAGLEVTAYIDMLIQEPSLLIDIKTSGVSFNETPGIVALDSQLRSYAWISGIKDVGFLWFTKTSRNIKKGDWVTVLDGELAGEEVSVVLAPKDKSGLVVTLNEKEHTIPISTVTKQRLQFFRGTISDEDRQEVGEEIGKQVAEIVDHNSRNFFPKNPGVRFPQNHCTFCEYLPICLGDNKKIEATLVKICPDADKDWLD